MNYKILPTAEFSKDFRKVDKQFQSRIKDKINEETQTLKNSYYLLYNKKYTNCIEFPQILS